MGYGLKYTLEKTNLNVFNWLKQNLDSRITHSLESILYNLNKVVFPHDPPLDHPLALRIDWLRNDLEKLVEYSPQNN